MNTRSYNTTMAVLCALLIAAGIACIAYGASAADLRVPPADTVTVDATVQADALGECRDAAWIAPGTTRVVRCQVDRLYPWALTAQVQTGSPTLQAWIVRANGAFVDVALRSMADRAERASVRITLTLGVPVGSLGAPVAGAVDASATRAGEGQGSPAEWTEETATPAAGTAGVI